MNQSTKETVVLNGCPKVTVGNTEKTSLCGWALPPTKETLLGNYQHSRVCCWAQSCIPLCVNI